MKKFICKLFGHIMSTSDIAAGGKCKRCGEDIPAIIWPRK